MRTRAAVSREPGKPWEITELELDEPGPGEARIAFSASGMYHSDEHLRTGHSTGRLPLVGGHEGAGVIEAVGLGHLGVRGRYRLDEINQGYQDLDDGKIIRGVILHAD